LLLPRGASATRAARRSRIAPALRDRGEAFAHFKDARVLPREEDWERDMRVRREAREREEEARERATTYYRPVLAVSDDSDGGDGEGDEGAGARMRKLRRERKDRRRREAAEAADREAAAAADGGRADADATRASSDDEADGAPVRPPPRGPRDAVINNTSGCVVRARASLESPRVGELAFETHVTDTGDRDYSRGRQRARIRAGALEGWISARLMRGI